MKILKYLGIVMLLLFCISSAYSISTNDNNNRAYYKLEDLTDATGRTGSFTNNGATGGVTGILDNAYDFDGTNDDMNRAVPAGVGSSSDFSVSLWVNADDVTTDQTIFDMTNGASDRNAINVHNGVIESRIYNGVSRDKSSTTVLTNTWYHIVLTWDVDTNTTILYLDTVVQSGTTGAVVSSSGSLYLGSQQNLGRFFDGTIDEVSIWNKTLTSPEVVFLYNTGSPTLNQQYNYPSSTPTTPGISTNLSSIYATGSFGGSFSTLSIVNMSLYLDNILLTQVNNTNLTSYSFTGVSAGSHNLSLLSEDINGYTWNNITVTIQPDQYFRFYDSLRSLYLEDYTFGSYSSNGTYVSINASELSVGSNSLLFSKFGYDLENFNFVINNTAQLNSTFNVSPVTITVQVYDESSPTSQLTFNLSMNNVSNYTQYLNEINFSKYYNETLTGNLTLTLESSGYSMRKIFTQLNPYSAVSHTVYLLNDADSSPVVFRCLNLAQTQSIEDVVFTFKKEVAGIPTFLGQAKTDSQGYTYFNMDVLEDYEITISQEGYVTQVINSIPGKVDYTILMEEEGNTNTYLYDDFSYLITPTSTPTSIPFNTSAYVFDESSLISSMRFTVTGDNTSETSVLTAASGGTIEFEILNESSQYILNLTVVRDSQRYSFIEKLNYYEPTTSNATVQRVAQELSGEENNSNRVFIIIIIYIVAVVLGSLFGPTIGAVAGLLPITIFAIPSVAWITPGIAALMYVFTILGVLYFER